MKNIILAEFKLLVESNSLELVEVVRTQKEQVWKIVATTKGQKYHLCPEKSRERYRTFSNLENACRCLVNSGCVRFEVDAKAYSVKRHAAV